MPASSFCGLPTSVSRRPSLNSSAIASALGAGQAVFAERESSSTSDQSSESFEALSDQISSKVVGSKVKLVVEVGAGGSDVAEYGPELTAEDAGRHTSAGLSERSAPAASLLFNFIILAVECQCEGL